jgi:hypothetical protein
MRKLATQWEDIHRLREVFRRAVDVAGSLLQFEVNGDVERGHPRRRGADQNMARLNALVILTRGMGKQLAIK